MGEFEELESSKVLLQKCGEIFYDTLTVPDVNHFQTNHCKVSTPLEEFSLLSDFEDVEVEKEILLTEEEDVNLADKDEDSTSQIEFILENAEGEMISDHDSNVLLPDNNEKTVAHSKPQAENSKRGEHNCPHCCKVFKRSWDLKQHLHIHDGLKPYKCEHCPASFAWKSGLRVHEKRHKGEKPFIWRKRGEHNCPQCSKVFKKAWDLKEHLHIHDGLKPYKCEHCSVSFACKSNLRAHEKRHDGERPFMCQFCTNTFLSAKQRRLHERSHTGERPFVCEFCGKSFSSSSGLQSHRSSQHLKERNFICGKCDKRFNRRSQLRLHQANMHTEKPRTHVCTICKAAFKDICVLKCHLTIHKEKTYQCLECGKKFANNSGLYSHRKRHEKQRFEELKGGEMALQKCGEIFYDSLMVSDVNVSFQCTFCQKAFTKLDAFLQHFETQHYKSSTAVKLSDIEEQEKAEKITFAEEGDVSQYVSDKDEDSISQLESNLESVEREMISDHDSKVILPDKNKKTSVHSKLSFENRQRQEHICPHCSKVFKRTWNLKQHLPIHDAMKPYKCEHCPASFVWKSGLKVHEKRHKGEIPFIWRKRGEHNCPQCSKVFKKAWDLKEHIHIHNGLKPYKCRHCSASFACKSNLRAHEKRHDGERPFVCQFCSNSFPSAKQQRCHERSHTGERPFICEFCGKSFPFSSGLLSHRSSQHLKERNFICGKCDKSFNRPSQLRLHQANMHTEKPRTHVCTICKAAFKDIYVLKGHLTIHKEKTYQCLECGKKFANNSGLYSHRKRHEKQRDRLLADILEPGSLK
uniref:C2H2-type domain-containing protein n=1 Tax=Glossina palpalis gambiensis TaxID=67801 RepID=A0A1B0BGL2_9MUSC